MVLVLCRDLPSHHMIVNAKTFFKGLVKIDSPVNFILIAKNFHITIVTCYRMKPIRICLAIFISIILFDTKNCSIFSTLIVGAGSQGTGL